MRKRGDIVWLSVAMARDRIGIGGEIPPDIAAIEVGIRHVGPVMAQRGLRRLRRLRLDETKRVLAVRAELGAEGPTIAPEFYGFDSLSEGEVKTPEGEEALVEAMREIFLTEDREKTLLAGTRGMDVDEKPADEQVDELERMNLLEVFLGPALEVQDPTVEFRPADASPSVAGPPNGSAVPASLGA